MSDDFLKVVGSRVRDTSEQSGMGHATGYWGHVTATVNWCEPDYVFSNYIAEMWNTLSSFAMVFVGLAGILFHYRDFEPRFKWAFSAVAVVGIGSAAFHGTLLFSLQMLDELPMIYSSLIMTYLIVEHEHVKPRYKWLPYLLALHGVITTIFVASPAFAPEYASPILQFICFHLAFASLEIFLIARTIGMYRRERDKLNKKVYITGLLLWTAGIACWVIDYLGCESIWEGEEGFRKKYLIWTVETPQWLQSIYKSSHMEIGVPNPQLHAFWHICASSGLYWMAVVIARSRQSVLKRKAVIQFALGVVPYVKVERKTTKDSPARTRMKVKDDDDLVVQSPLLASMDESPRRRSAKKRAM